MQQLQPVAMAAAAPSTQQTWTWTSTCGCESHTLTLRGSLLHVAQRDGGERRAAFVNVDNVEGVHAQPACRLLVLALLWLCPLTGALALHRVYAGRYTWRLLLAWYATGAFGGLAWLSDGARLCGWASHATVALSVAAPAGADGAYVAKVRVGQQEAIAEAIMLRSTRQQQLQYVVGGGGGGGVEMGAYGGDAAHNNV